MRTKLVALLHATLPSLWLALAVTRAEFSEVRVENALVTLRGHAGGVNRLAFSSDGSVLACAVGDYMSRDQVVVWDVAATLAKLERPDVGKKNDVGPVSWDGQGNAMVS